MSTGRKIYWSSVAVAYSALGLAWLAGHFFEKGHAAGLETARKRLKQHVTVLEDVVDRLEKAETGPATRTVDVDVATDETPAAPSNVITLYPHAV